jgi:hypothetical protein
MSEKTDTKKQARTNSNTIYGHKTHPDDEQFESVDDENEPPNTRKPDRVFSECGWGVHERLFETR